MNSNISSFALIERLYIFSSAHFESTLEYFCFAYHIDSPALHATSNKAEVLVIALFELNVLVWLL